MSRLAAIAVKLAAAATVSVLGVSAIAWLTYPGELGAGTVGTALTLLGLGGYMMAADSLLEGDL